MEVKFLSRRKYLGWKILIYRFLLLHFIYTPTIWNCRREGLPCGCCHPEPSRRVAALASKKKTFL